MITSEEDDALINLISTRPSVPNARLRMSLKATMSMGTKTRAYVSKKLVTLS